MPAWPAPPATVPPVPMPPLVFEEVPAVPPEFASEPPLAVNPPLVTWPPVAVAPPVTFEPPLPAGTPPVPPVWVPPSVPPAEQPTAPKVMLASPMAKVRTGRYGIFMDSVFRAGGVVARAVWSAETRTHRERFKKNAMRAQRIYSTSLCVSTRAVAKAESVLLSAITMRGVDAPW
jgi:hypothetical protein